MRLNVTWRQIAAGAIVAGSSLLGMTQPWQAAVSGDDSQQGEDNQMGDGNAGDDLVHEDPGGNDVEGDGADGAVLGDDQVGRDQAGEDIMVDDQAGRDVIDGGQAGRDVVDGDQAGEDAIGRDDISGDRVGRDQVADDSVSGDQVGRDHVGDDAVSGDQIGRDQVGDDSIGGDVGDRTQTETDNSRTDDHSDRSSRDNGGSGQMATDNATINNNIPANWGKATFLGAWSADGQDTFGPSVVLELDVDLPTNGNDMFLACEFISRDGEPHLWFAKQQIVANGRQTITVHFGGPHVNADPYVVGTTRRCHVVSAEATASRTLLRLMDMNEQGIEVDPTTGRYYNESRRSLPYGSGVVSTNDVLITIEHV